MIEVPPPPQGPKWNIWGERLNSYLRRNMGRLPFARGGESAADDGLIAWDRSEGHMVVSDDGEYKPLEYGRNDHGSFYCTNDSTAASADTAYAIVWNQTAYNKNVTINASDDTRVDFEKGGLFLVEFTAQIFCSTSSSVGFWFWPRVNGVDVAGSTMKTTIKDNGQTRVIARAGMFRMSAGDYLQAMWAVDDTDGSLAAHAATAFAPASPCATMSVTGVDV